MGSSGKYKSLRPDILGIAKELDISENEIRNFMKYDFPLFSFRYFRDKSVKKCKRPEFFVNFLNQLKDISQLSWYQVRQSGRHEYGFEKLPKEKIKTDWNLFKDIMTPEVRKVDVFRADNLNHPMIGLIDGRVFHVFFIEAEFGDIYIH